MVRERFSQDVIREIESSAVLSDEGIQLEILRGKIVIEPFSVENLQSSSYDLTLGEHYFVRVYTEPGVMNIYNQEVVKKIWGESNKAILTKDLKKKRFIPGDFWNGIGEEDSIIVVPPKGVLLVHSQEFAGARDDYTTMVKSKSTLERLGVTTAISAGLGDVGFINRWTFLLRNEHENSEVILKVGMPFAQIVFIKCTPTEARYVSSGGRYQSTEDLQELMNSWRPEDMLPRVPI